MAQRQNDGERIRVGRIAQNVRLELSPITITVPGTPVPKGRPRHTRAGRAYTPAKTRSYERLIAQMARLAMRTRLPITGPVRMCIIADLPIPQSWSKRRKAHAFAGLILPTGKPDASNLQKSAEDALNNIVYVDDAQIVSLEVMKRYGIEPGLRIIVTPIAARGVSS